jgi:23S rRNA (guanosine2251-2'-O)-methyltransferase
MDEVEYIYGVNPCFEIVRSANREVDRAWVNEKQSSSPRLKKLVQFMEREGVRISFTDKERIFRMCQSKDHQGVVLETRPYHYMEQEGIWGKNRILLLDNIEDPQNLGAIIRSAEVLGFNALLLPLKGVPGIYPSVVKAAAGATEYVKISRYGGATKYTISAKQKGYKIVALDAKGTTPLNELAFAADEKVMLVIGGEDKSVGQFILNEADHVVAIPQLGQVNSLNASVAAGIAMYVLRGSVD